MKISILTYCFIAVALLVSPAGSRECSNCYEKYSNSTYGYRLLIPKGWKRSEANLDYKHILILSKSRYTEISISATKPDRSDLSKWKDWYKWYIKGIGKRLRRIIETKNVLIEKEIVGKILLFEYIYRGRSVLQRVLIAKFNDNMIIIECRSTLTSFKNYTDLFNVVMGSLKINK